jgi:hypothetical protein
LSGKTTPSLSQSPFFLLHIPFRPHIIHFTLAFEPGPAQSLEGPCLSQITQPILLRHPCRRSRRRPPMQAAEQRQPVNSFIACFSQPSLSNGSQHQGGAPGRMATTRRTPVSETCEFANEKHDAHLVPRGLSIYHGAPSGAPSPWHKAAISACLSTPPC